jgi:predicted metal-dependent hydrolase
MPNAVPPAVLGAAPLPRTPKVVFRGVPKNWLAASQAASHIANGVNLLFPAGERFFVRSVRHYLDQVSDPDLRARAKGFFGQEGRHAQAHERYFETMRAQGYEIDAWLARYEKVAYGVIERVSPPAVRLAATVACEHFTAILAEDALDGQLLEHAHPEMRRLLMWLAVEELEHKSVAFDVLRAVNPSYALRMLGLFISTTLLGAFWVGATRELLRQDGMTLRDAARDLRALRAQAERLGAKVRPIATRVFGQGIRQYLRPGFHPSDKDHRALVERTLARLVAEGVVSDAGVEEAAQ